MTNNVTGVSASAETVSDRSYRPADARVNETRAAAEAEADDDDDELAAVRCSAETCIHGVCAVADNHQSSTSSRCFCIPGESYHSLKV